MATVSIEATVYIRPYGKTKGIEVLRIRPEDAKYINENNIKVSMEDLGEDYVIWFDYGAKTYDGEPDELTVLAEGRNCEDTIADAVKIIKEIKAKPKTNDT